MFSAAFRGARELATSSSPGRVRQSEVRALNPGRLPPVSVSYYWDTTVPTPEQLKRAERFFWKAPPKLLFSSTEFRNVKVTNLPEVAFLGRSNVGKSSILNALMGKEICHTSSKPGRTRSMNFFSVGGDNGQGIPGKLAVLDMPGYGKGSRHEWGTEVLKYLMGRKQLRRAFLLVDALHGLKPSDAELLSLFRKYAIPHQIILSKVDRILFKKSTPSAARLERNSPQLDAIVDGLRPQIQPGKGDGPEALGEIIACSASTTMDGTKIGINNVRWAVLAATGLGEEKRMLRPSEIAESGTASTSDIGESQPANSKDRDGELPVLRNDGTQHERHRSQVSNLLTQYRKDKPRAVETQIQGDVSRKNYERRRLRKDT